MDVSNPNDDVPLTDGEGYFVQSGPYKHHLETAKEFPNVDIFMGQLTNAQC
jgi:hypothetical protein